jgi:hypothetical protein
MFTKWLFGFITLICQLSFSVAQDTTIVQNHWRNQPMSIEDNSFLVEEAFNQSPGVIQYTVINQVNRGIAELNLECEMPLKGEFHQLSVSIPAKVFQSTVGIEDIMISYRPLLLDRHRWAMVTPRVSVILPTGKVSRGFGDGSWGIECNVALTKQLSRRLISHVNVGSSSSFKKMQEQLHQNRLHYESAGTSLIFAAAKGLDLMAEVTTSNVKLDSNAASTWNFIGNPGFRFCLKMNQFLVVPGMSAPFTLLSGRATVSEVLIYISIERVR